MRIALASDEYYPEIHETLLAEIQARGHEVTCYGAFLPPYAEKPWVPVIAEASIAVSNGTCQEGIFCCWSGTGASMVANKTPGLRAALCPDPESAQLARLWNHANVLILSNRLLLTSDVRQIVEAWFAPFDPNTGKEGVETLSKMYL